MPFVSIPDTKSCVSVHSADISFQAPLDCHKPSDCFPMFDYLKTVMIWILQIREGLCDPVSDVSCTMVSSMLGREQNVGSYVHINIIFCKKKICIFRP